MLRISLIAVLVLLVCGCDLMRPAAADCRQKILARLKSPGTYKEISVSDQTMGTGGFVWIEFDSQNGFGALIRNKATCRYDAKNGAIDYTKDNGVLFMDNQNSPSFIP